MGAEHRDGEIKIYLSKGQHYAIRDYPKYTRTKSSTSLVYSIFIDPLYCSVNNDNPAICTTPTEKVEILNKKRSWFSIEVPKKLTLTNIVINSLDSYRGISNHGITTTINSGPSAEHPQ